MGGEPPLDPRLFALVQSKIGARSQRRTWLALALLPLTATRGLTPQPALHLLGAPCALLVALSGGCALSVAALFYRRALPIAAGAHAALLGVACAAWAGLVISLHCAGESFQHLLWGLRAAGGGVAAVDPDIAAFFPAVSLTVRLTSVDTQAPALSPECDPSEQSTHLIGLFDCQIAISLAILEAFDSAASTRARV